MDVVYSEHELLERVDEALEVSQGHSIAIDHFVSDGIELDVDFIGDGKRACIVGIMEQVEEAGIHSGDSACCLPARRLSEPVLAKVREYTTKLASALKIIGLANIQMVVKGDTVTVLELNARASRTVPFVSKATGVQVAKLSARIQVTGESLDDLGLPIELSSKGFAVKVPVFPFSRFPTLDPRLGAEMKSTGETMGIGSSFEEAYVKALAAAGIAPKGEVVVSDCGKWSKVIVDKFRQAGFSVTACETSKALELVSARKAGLLISGIGVKSGGSARSAAAMKGIPVVSSAFSAIALCESIRALNGRGVADMPVTSLNDFTNGGG